MEVEDHVFERMAELEASGTPPEEAERLAVQALGSAEELGSELLRTQRAFSISPRLAVWLGIRTGLCVAAVSLAGAVFDATPMWDDVSPLYYVAIAGVLLAAFPARVIRPFLAAHAYAVAATRAKDPAAVTRLQEPAARFFGALMMTASAPFLLWILACGARLPLGLLEGPMVRSIHGAFVVNIVMLVPICLAVLQASPQEARRKAR